MKLYRPLAATALAATLGLGLTGCFGNPLESLAQNGIEQAVEQATGSDVSIDTDGTGASLPDSFPDSVPMIDGRIVSSMSAGDTWSVTVSVDSADAAKDGYDDLLAAGFTETSALDLGDDNVLNTTENDEYVVSYSWLSDGDNGWTVTYGVALKQ
jgi:hypothetical protein